MAGGHMAGGHMAGGHMAGGHVGGGARFAGPGHFVGAPGRGTGCVSWRLCRAQREPPAKLLHLHHAWRGGTWGGYGTAAGAAGTARSGMAVSGTADSGREAFYGPSFAWFTYPALGLRDVLVERYSLLLRQRLLHLEPDL